MVNSVVFFSHYPGIMTVTLPLLLKQFVLYFVVHTLPHLFYLPPDNIICHNANYFNCKSSRSAVERINNINPNFVIVWNGFFEGMQETLKMLNKHIKIIYVEWGWTNHYKTISFHRNGPHAYSSLVNFNLDLVVPNFELATEYFKANYLKLTSVANISRDYILIPLQLEADTQLIASGFTLGEQVNLVTFVRDKFPNKNIVVKIHPLATNKEEVKTVCTKNNCVYVEDKRIIDWIFYSDFVVGINSTSLIESIFLNKKVAAFGKNVYSNKNLVLDCCEDPNNIVNIDKFSVNKTNVCKFMTLLDSRQITNIPEEVTQFDYDKLKRFMESYET